MEQWRTTKRRERNVDVRVVVSETLLGLLAGLVLGLLLVKLVHAAGLDLTVDEGTGETSTISGTPDQSAIDSTEAREWRCPTYRSSLASACDPGSPFSAQCFCRRERPYASE